MKLFLRTGPPVLAALILAVSATTGHASLVTDFFTLKADPATTLSGTGNTANPSLGTTATTSVGSRLIGYFTPQTLANVGDSIALSFTVTFNDAVGTYGTSGDNFRFALYDRSLEAIQETTNSNLNVVGTTNTDNFRGYWFGVDTTAGTNGSIRQLNNDANVDPFVNGSAELLGTPTGTPVTFTGQTNGGGLAVPYTGLMTLTLSAPGEVTLSGSFAGNGGANVFSFVDTTAVATTFGAVGFLNAQLSIDQANFSNVDVTRVAIPEPATWVLGACSLVGLALVRRRRS